VFVGDEKTAQQMEKMLFDEGVYALAIAYPTVALGRARIRTMPSAAHSQDDLDFALQAFIKVRDKLAVAAK
jgi:glycine C-acetyltransferase